MIKEKFENFIKNINDYNYKFSLYAKSLPIQLSETIILNEELYEVKDKIDGFNYIIGVEDLKDVLSNLQEQISDNSDIYLCADAINYYIENDAFIDLEHDSNQ